MRWGTAKLDMLQTAGLRLGWRLDPARPLAELQPPATAPTARVLLLLLLKCCCCLCAAPCVVLCDCLWLTRKRPRPPTTLAAPLLHCPPLLDCPPLHAPAATCASPSARLIASTGPVRAPTAVRLRAASLPTAEQCDPRPQLRPAPGVLVAHVHCGALAPALALAAASVTRAQRRVLLRQTTPLRTSR